MQGQHGTLAQATTLGWVLSGATTTMISNASEPIHTMHCCLDENDTLKKFWELESDIRMPREKLLTNQKKYCEEYFEKTPTKDNDGRYMFVYHLIPIIQR